MNRIVIPAALGGDDINDIMGIVIRWLIMWVACDTADRYSSGGDDNAPDAGARDASADVRRDAAVKPHPDAAADAAAADRQIRPDAGVSDGQAVDGPSSPEAGAPDAAVPPPDVGVDAYVTTPPQWDSFTCTASYSTVPEVQYGMRMVSTAPSSSERNHFIGAARFSATAGTDPESEEARQSLPANEWECDACTIPEYAGDLTGIYYIEGSFESPDAGTTATVSIANYTSGGAVSSAAIFPMTPCLDPACDEIESIDPSYTNEIYPAYGHSVEVPVACAPAEGECASFAGETILDNGETFRLECVAE